MSLAPRFRRRCLVLSLIVLVYAFAVPAPSLAQLMIVGNDEKMTWDAAGKQVFLPPGKDTVSIIDITNREAPKIVASLPLMNSIIGPPTNLAITPDGRLAIVANALNWVQDGAGWKSAPDNRLYIINLATQPPRHIATVEVGRQPSGLAINPHGDLLLVACREDKSINVLAIQGDDVKLIDRVSVDDPVVHVVFTPDGNRALAAKFLTHKVALLNVNGQQVTYAKYDMPTGLQPINIDVTPDGKLALVANVGFSDGHVDTVSVIDLEAKPPRVIDHVVVGDAPEGLAMSPTGEFAIAVLLRASNQPKTAWYYNENSSVVVLKIDGKKVTKVGEVEVGGLAEGVVFSPDGKYLYVGNYLDSDVSILKVDGTTVTDTGKRLQLPGHPASMRGRAR
jgi:DNA-binding beta-propeller fold protein YncE